MRKLILSLLIVLVSIAGCGKEPIEKVIETVRTETVQLPPAVQDLVSQIVADENAFRLSKGQLPLAPGLTCTLHNLLATTPSLIPTSPPSAVATFAYIGSFNQPDASASDGLNILPAALKPLYLQWFLVKCSGYIVIEDSGYRAFSLRSDDGSKLYLNGTSASNLVIDNDGNHGPLTKTGAVQLHRGIVSISLQYMQGPAGSQALVLEDENGVIPGAKFYR